MDTDGKLVRISTWAIGAMMLVQLGACGQPSDEAAMAEDAVSSTRQALSGSAPVASSVDMTSSTGLDYTGATQTGSYTYSDADGDAESGSTYQWYRKSSSGTITTISGATSKSYTATANDSYLSIRFCVTPSDGQQSGSQVCSSWNSIIPSVTWYQDGLFSGNSLTMGYIPGICFNLTYNKFEDLASSVKFYGSPTATATLTYYKDTGCTGTSGTATTAAGTQGSVSRFGPLGWNDMISSFIVSW